MNEHVPGERLGDEENTRSAARPNGNETSTDRSVTGGLAVGHQTSQGPSRTRDAHPDVPETEGTPSMSRPAGRAAAPPSDDALASTAAPGRRRGGAAMVVFALIVGALIGAGVVAATQSNDDPARVDVGSTSSPATAASGETPSVGPTPSPTTAAVIPAICMNLADDAQVIVDLSTQAAVAARDLKASALSSIVRELDSAQQQLRKDTAACRAAQTGA